LYAEDADLCFKAERAGFRNYYLGEARVIHHGGRNSDSISKNNFAALVMRESLLRFLRKYRSNRYAAAYRATMALGAAVRVLLVGAILGITFGQFRRSWLSAALAKWVKVFRWTFGMEGWVKNLTHKDSSGEDLISVPAQKG
jgi:hypothetical protein